MFALSSLAAVAVNLKMVSYKRLILPTKHTNSRQRIPEMETIKPSVYFVGNPKKVHSNRPKLVPF
ncbi:MAG: hypothetical protein DME77_11625 [Verrucomicrobia bacterium]|nr:MAG: hypothetical protein DME77_11625 [Verrucomicrobiota bacterium]PYL13757.1 MAG: hypothetical protein DMF43_03980 [Verrucomicrobiota bacterium]